MCVTNIILQHHEPNHTFHRATLDKTNKWENTKQKRTERVLCVFQFFSASIVRAPYIFIFICIVFVVVVVILRSHLLSTKHLSELHVCVAAYHAHTCIRNPAIERHTQRWRTKEMDLMPSPHYTTAPRHNGALTRARCNRMCSRLYRLSRCIAHEHDIFKCFVHESPKPWARATYSLTGRK